MINNDAKKCIVLGGGGHARVLIDCLLGANPELELAILDNSPLVTEVLGIPVSGNDDAVYQLRDHGFTHFALGVGSIGDTSIRRRIHTFALKCDLKPLTVIHRDATVSEHATLAPGCQIFARAVVNPGAILKEGCLVNTGAIVEHDCLLEPFAHISTGAILAGGVMVGTGTHVGLNACVRERIIIGSNVIIGAGAVVVKNVPPNNTVIGIPARPVHATD